MEQAGSGVNMALLVGVAAAVLFIGLALWAGTRASRDPESVRKAQRVLYACLIFEGVFLIAMAGLSGLFSVRRDLEQVYGMLFGILAGFPAGLAGLLAIFLILMLLREAYVHRVVLPTVAAIAIVFVLVKREPWLTILVALCGAGLLVAALRGWRATRRTGAAGPVA